MRKNDGMRGTWHFTGQYWFCDCRCGGPVLQIGGGQGGSIERGKSHSPNVSRCRRCECLRPLARDRPKLSDALPHGMKRLTGEEKEAASKELE